MIICHHHTKNASRKLERNPGRRGEQGILNGKLSISRGRRPDLSLQPSFCVTLNTSTGLFEPQNIKLPVRVMEDNRHAKKEDKTTQQKHDVKWFYHHPEVQTLNLLPSAHPWVQRQCLSEPWLFFHLLNRDEGICKKYLNKHTTYTINSYLLTGWEFTLCQAPPPTLPLTTSLESRRH